MRAADSPALDSHAPLVSRVGISCSVIRTRAISHPEEVTCAVPEAVASSLEHKTFRKSSDDIDKTARMETSERGLKVRLLPLTLWMPKLRQKHFPIQHNGSIRRKHQIREAVHGREKLNRSAEVK